MPSQPLDLLLRYLEQRVDFSDEDRDAILALPIKLKTLHAGSYVVREGEPPGECAVLLSGFAYRHKLTGDGTRQIVSIHIPGEALDFQNLFLDVADHNVQTLTRAEVALISRRELQELARSRSAVGQAILAAILVEAAIFREWVVNVGRRDARTRMAHMLCELAVRLDAYGLSNEMGYELPMTQTELADVLGLTPVHVNRVLKGLEADGLISRSKREVRFPDWEKMRELGDFSDRYLHLKNAGEAYAAT